MTTEARPPDRPIVPRPRRRSLAASFAIGFALLVVGGYAALAVTERELGQQQRDEIPASVRASPGGYRSYSFWYVGYHGGK